jgi:hypothetical protein
MICALLDGGCNVLFGGNFSHFFTKKLDFFSCVNSIYFAIYLVKFRQIYDTTEKKKKKRANVIFC